MSKFLNLKYALQDAGWTVTQMPLASDCWWAKEIWRLTSQWSPEGQVIYLSLLLDPADNFDENNPPDTSVWAVNLSSGVPRDRPIGGISVKNHFAKRVEEIVALAGSNRVSEKGL